MWQQCSAQNPADTGRKVQLRFTTEWRKKCDLCDFDCGMIVGARLFEYFFPNKVFGECRCIK